MSDNYSLFESLQLKGMFWIPENPTDRMVGDLFYQPGESIELDLFGVFEQPGRKRGLFDNFSPKVVHGIAATGQELTLYRIFPAGSSVPSRGYKRSKHSAIYLFIGAHLEDPEKDLFSNVCVSPTHLESWLFSRPYKFRDSKKNNLDGNSVRFRAPKKMKWRLDGRESTVETTYTFSAGSESWCSIKWEFLPFLKVTPDVQKNFEWFFRFSHATSNLLSLLLGQPSYPRFFQLFQKKGEKSTAVDVLWVAPNSKVKAKESIHPAYLLAPFPLIRKRVNSIFNSFYDAHASFGSIYDTFFSQFSDYDTYVESQFLAIIQALEQYHRIKNTRHYLTDKKFSDVESHLLKAVPSRLPDDFINSLHSKIHHANEYSLRTRLKLLLNGLDSEVRDEFFPKSRSFINKVVEERNTLIHGTSKASARQSSLNNLHYAAKQLQVLLLIQLLRDARIPAKTYQKGILLRYKWLRDQVQGKDQESQ